MIKIYYAKISEFTQADYTHQYSLLDCALKKKIDSKKIKNDKLCSLAGYILLYRGARELYNKSDFSVYFNKNGKPLCNFFNFSISHSETDVVCAFSDKPVGIDIQKIKPLKARPAYRFFSQKENDYVNCDVSLSGKRYTEVFAKKEAAVKMLGITLSQGSQIDTFSKDFCFEIQERGEFLIAVCCKNNGIL